LDRINHPHWRPYGIDTVLHNWALRLTDGGGHNQPLGRTENHANEGPVFSSLSTYRMNRRMALDRPKPSLIHGQLYFRCAAIAAVRGRPPNSRWRPRATDFNRPLFGRETARKYGLATTGMRCKLKTLTRIRDFDGDHDRDKFSASRTLQIA
jgi:hypothetical protein